jgi:para-aminobenzoate synthetase / 4-amino-4-deoxychorismate lyase
MIKPSGFNRKPGLVVLKDAARNCWLSFSRPISVIQVDRTADVLPALVQVEREIQRRDLVAAGFISYEAAPGFNPMLQVRETEDFPLLWFGLYDSLKRVSLPIPVTHNSFSWIPSIQQDEYVRSIQKIKDYIRQGWTYQVNYTLRLRTGFQADAWELFLQLANAQQADYAAYVDTGDWAICSASPELFLSRRGRDIVSLPMKGTARRGCTLAEDRAQAAWLESSEKNRAENVMIVDMVRNDMGRIAEIGSVSVPKLFEVIRFPTVWQMISTVTSRTDAPFSEIIKAMFPCASITGAPKVSTMRIIAELETEPRRVYTGSIGFLAQDNRAQFNVAIRTVVVDRLRNQAEYGVGGGIVWDSDALDEFKECEIKALVLNAPLLVFSLLETCLWRPQDSIFLWDYHLRRLHDSAQYFAYPLNVGQLNQKLARLDSSLPPVDHRIRILVDRQGSISTEAAPFHPADPGQIYRLRIAPSPVNSTNPFLYHKTTNRKVYEDAGSIQSSKLHHVENGIQPDLEDVIFWNERREVTETSIANLVYRISEDLFTPPLNSGLLPGVFRAFLLDQGLIKERVLMLDDLPKCDEFFIINSLRLWRKARLFTQEI